MKAGDTLGPATFHASGDKMKIYAALLRDPNPIHWDADEVAARGLGRRLINQGPVNLGYVTNLLADACGGPDAIARLTVRFGENVREGDEVVAHGVVTGRDGDLATIDVWLELPDGTRAVDGTAVVRVTGE